jgi:5-formyl-3-hydroxy-2-methylpyridine 4-carboxylate dehydrogenase
MTKAAVIGLGTMGPGIAATLARAGMAVAAFDADPGQRHRAPKGLETAAGVLARLGLPDRGGAVTLRDSLAVAVEDAELVVETVPEKLELKIEVFRQVEAVVGPDCVLASDTSGIPITKIQEALSAPARVVGMHWSNPPHIIPMIEVIAGARTAPEVVRRMVDWVRLTGHLPVVIKKDVPGFVENRVLYAVMRECVDLVEKGVIDAADLDTCVTWGIGYKL